MAIMNHRPKKPRLWLALADFHQNQNDSAKAFDAWKRGLKCDESLETREGRMCALRLCGSSISLSERWMESVVATRDKSIQLPEAIEVVKRLLESYMMKREYHKGDLLCSKLMEVFHEVRVCRQNDL